MSGRSLIGRIRRGAGYLPGYGEHPGTTYLMGMIVIGGAAGAQNGFPGFAVGAGGMAAVMVPIWLTGCVGRADDYDRRQARLAADDENTGLPLSGTRNGDDG